MRYSSMILIIIYFHYQPFFYTRTFPMKKNSCHEFMMDVQVLHHMDLCDNHKADIYGSNIRQWKK
jgi:hypothetical protein